MISLTPHPITNNINAFIKIELFSKYGTINRF